MENQNLFELRIDAETTSFFGQAARWAKFLSIVGFVVCGLIVLSSFFMGAIMSAMSGIYGERGMAAAGGAMTVVYILIALLYFFPCLFLYNFASKMQVALRTLDQEAFNKSAGNLKSCFKFVGIVTLIVLSFYALLLVFGLGGALLMS